MIRQFKIYICFSLLSVIAGRLPAQSGSAKSDTNPYALIDGLMAEKSDSARSLAALANCINANFTNEYQKTRAIFSWLNKNIRYAPELMYSFTNNASKAKVVKDAYTSRQGVCTGYAYLFDTLAKLCKLNAFVVYGSTRQNFLPAIIGHAWNAVNVLGEWQLIDATWGSGYLRGSTFVQKTDNDFFLATPNSFIETHLPMDPIWQLLTHPISLDEFHRHAPSSVTADWNFTDSIKTYLGADELSKVQQVIRRLNQFGNNSDVTFNYTNYLKSCEYEIYNKMLKHAVKNQNKAVSDFNTYVEFKNHQFSPALPDAELRKMLPKVILALDTATTEYNFVLGQTNDESVTENVKSNLDLIADLKKRSLEEQKFVDKYLLTTKNKRRDLFYTKVYTIYGKPIK